MTHIFNYLYDIHPLLPLGYLAILVNGIAMPPLYCVFRQQPVSLNLILVEARAGRGWAVYAKYSSIALIACSILVVGNISTRV